MTSKELANRAGVTQQRILEIENNEVQETIRLETLRRIANALDCDLMYVLLPRKTLEETVKAQALRKARHRLKQVAHHSRLEGQEIGEDEETQQVESMAASMIDRRGLWSETSLTK
jgi:predicted DNA-binding mobile mystery protein A